MIHKRRLLVAIICLAVTAGVSPGSGEPPVFWNHLPVKNIGDWRGLHFIDENYGFLVSRQGYQVTLNYDDSLWISQDKILERSLNGICFSPGGETGIAYGARGRLYRTLDSGRNWSIVSISPKYWFYDMVYRDSYAFLVGTELISRGKSTGLALVTVDRGQSWKRLEIEGNSLISLDIAPDETITIVDQQGILISRDTGQVWEKLPIPGEGPAKAAAVRGKRGIMVGLSGFLALSEDGGRSWYEFDVIPENISLVDLEMVDSRRAYAIGGNGVILYTEDGGYNWTPQIASMEFDLEEIHRAGNRVFVGGKTGALMYIDVDD